MSDKERLQELTERIAKLPSEIQQDIFDYMEWQEWLFEKERRKNLTVINCEGGNK